MAEGGRHRDTELVIPICVGTVAFHLGKKAQSDYHSHRWTVYLRGAHNQDLSAIVQKVTFGLHESFANPNRDILSQPYELTETGWGEFDISVTVHFVPEAQAAPVELLHKLKLFEEVEQAPHNPKKPVIKETYEEIVLSEPPEALLQRVRVQAASSHPFKVSELAAYFPRWSDREEAGRIFEARQRVALMMQQARAAYEVLPVPMET